MNVTIFGMGYVGVVTSACLAKLGHHVTGVDVVQQKVDMIKAGRSPIVEPGLQELVEEGVQSGLLTAISSSQEAMHNTDVMIICVGTPSRANGDVDTTALLYVANEIADYLKENPADPVIIFRSTMPPGTMEDLVEPIFAKKTEGLSATPYLFYHPEFLREGAAIKDFFEAPQVVVASVDGALDFTQTKVFFDDLYRNIDIHFQYVDTKTAEMIKYVNNTFHALKVSFANEIGRVCRSYSIDSHELFDLFLADTKLNVSSAYLRPGFAFGGSCLPKDLRALSKMASRADVNVPIISHVEKSNKAHIDLALELILQSKHRKVAFLGLSFKTNTDDVRESPFLELAEKCIGKGLQVNIFDRSIDYGALTGRNLAFLQKHLEHISNRLASTLEEAVTFADLVVLSHPEQLYLETLQTVGHKKVLDLSGYFNQAVLSENRLSIILSRDLKRKQVLERERTNAFSI